MYPRARILLLLICLLPLIALPASASVAFSSSTPVIITKGDALSITGINAINGTSSLWVIGRNYIGREIIIPDTKGNFSLSLNSAATRDYTSGQYAFVVQDPGPDLKLDIEYRVDDNGDIILLNQGRTFADIGARENLRASVVPLISEFSSTAANPGADDVFTPYYFIVENPSISFDHMSDPVNSRLADVKVGDPIILEGQTNVNPRDSLRAEIRGSENGAPAASANLAVIPGATVNRWRWVLDNPGLPPGSYEVTIWRTDAFVSCSGSAILAVLPGATATTNTSGNTTGSIPWSSDPLLPFIILAGLALVIASILFASRNR